MVCAGTMKYNYTNGTIQSGVALLKDGRAYEVRRNEKTKFADGERRTWASLDEWRASLPAGGAETCEDTHTRKPPAIMNPVLKRLHERIATLPHAIVALRRNTVGIINYKDWYTSMRDRYLESINRNTRLYGAENTYVQRAMEKVAEIDKILKISYVDKDRYCIDTTPPSYLFTMTPDGQLVRVYYSRKLNVVLVHTGVIHPLKDVSTFIRGFDTFEPVTDPEIPLWYVNRNTNSLPVKI
jgi:hypothetical protein